ncbi:MAG: DNA primase DnaG [Candidatus Micrarchaeia archaeon]
MGKTYLEIVKYVIYANVEVDGLVEKSDVVGAIFGQTEGLLGEELDIRELQRSGKVGRIEINLTTRGNKTFGKIIIPSSLDMVETSILGAAIEIVDRVGPFEARIITERIEDTRNEKRRKILQRSKELLKELVSTQIPDTKELTEKIKEEVKISEVVEYGEEKLPAGPDIDKENEIIIVEGRADVINLLRNGITNCIAMGGATVPKTIIELCRKKEATLFVDGDRGGEMIIKELTRVAEVDFIARAPAGKEVEELTKKEIIKALRNKVPVIENKALEKEEEEKEEEGYEKDLSEEEIKPIQEFTTEEIEEEGKKEEENEEKPVLYGMATQNLMNALDELRNTLRARFYDANGNLLKEMPIRELLSAIYETQKSPYAIVLDGVVTQRLVEEASKRGVKEIYAQRIGNVFRLPPNIKIYTKQEKT